MDREADSIDSVPVEAWMPNERSRQYLCQSAWPKPDRQVSSGSRAMLTSLQIPPNGLGCTEPFQSVCGSDNDVVADPDRDPLECSLRIRLATDSPSSNDH